MSTRTPEEYKSREWLEQELKKQKKYTKTLWLCLAVVIAMAALVVGLSLSTKSDAIKDTLKGWFGYSTSDAGTHAKPTSEELRKESEKAYTTAKVLPVVSLDTKTPYDRTGQFGEAWKDVDGNGCDTRNDILKRDLRDVTTAGRNNCRVTSGVFTDPYTGKTIHFKYGKDTSSEVQIDHVVALHDAWMTGAQNLTQQQREELANDPENLLAVDGPENQSKGDGLCLNGKGCTGMYLPPNKEYQCEYAGKFTEVKAKYNLGLTEGQKSTLLPLLKQCSVA